MSKYVYITNGKQLFHMTVLVRLKNPVVLVLRYIMCIFECPEGCFLPPISHVRIRQSVKFSVNWISATQPYNLLTGSITTANGSVGHAKDAAL